MTQKYAPRWEHTPGRRRKMGQKGVLSQYRPFESQEGIIGQGRVLDRIRNLEHDDLVKITNAQERERRVHAHEREVQSRRKNEDQKSVEVVEPFGKERNERLQLQERELNQKRTFAQEREARLLAQERELSQKRSQGGIPPVQEYLAARPSKAYKRYSEDQEEFPPLSKKQGRSSYGEVSPSFGRSFAQERFMAQKRELQMERSMIRNRERSMYQDIHLGRDYVPFHNPETTWQGGMAGMRELLGNKMLLTVLAVFGVALIIIMMMLVFRT